MLQNVKNISNLLPPDVLFQALNAPKPVFGRGSASEPTEGAYDATQTPSQLGRAMERTPPHTFPLNALILVQIW